MIIDVHTHAPRFKDEVPADVLADSINTKWNPAASRALAYTWAHYEEVMAPVDRAICFNIAQAPSGNERVHEPYLGPAIQVNDETAAFVNARSDKFIGFLSVHPDDPDKIEEMERATQDLGLKGVKLGLNYQNADPLGAGAAEIFRYAEGHGLPLMLHQGTSPVQFADIDFAHPRHTDRIAMAFPKLTIIMAHIGHPFYIDSLVVARKHPNVWIDTSAAVLRPYGLYQALVAAQEWGVMDRLMFATDYPASTPEESLRLLRDVNAAAPGPTAPRIDERKIEEIIYRDSLSLLGLD